MKQYNLILLFSLIIHIPCLQTYQDITYIRSLETLEKIKEVIESKQKGALLRFGDGDLDLAYGKRSGRQETNTKLQFEMIDTFQMNNNNILKTLALYCADHCGQEAVFFYSHTTLGEKECLEIRKKAQKIWGKKLDVIYSPVALPYTAMYMQKVCIEFLTFLKNQNCVLVVGNNRIPKKIRSLLFGECKFVATPGENAYKKINHIEKKILESIPQKSDEYRIVIMSCGNTGRVLTKRLWLKLENVFFFDFGSLMDSLCGFKSRFWSRNNSFDHKQFINDLIAYQENQM